MGRVHEDALAKRCGFFYVSNNLGISFDISTLTANHIFYFQDDFFERFFSSSFLQDDSVKVKTRLIAVHIYVPAGDYREA